MIDVGDIVRVHSGTYHGNTGRVVSRRPTSVDIRDFHWTETVYGVVFEDEAKGPGFPVYFKLNQIERIYP